MPAKKDLTLSQQDQDVLTFSVSGDLEKRRSVYFTDQSPRFTITVENVSDLPIEGSTIARTTYEESDRPYESGEHVKLEVDLDPGESTDFTLSLDMLSYQGSAAVAFARSRVRNRDDHWELTKSTGTSIRRLYTFMVYDRDYYKVNYLRPRRAQYVAAFLAVLIVLVGTGQILTFWMA